LSTVLALWRRVPVVVRAVLTGLAVAAAGTTPWALLVSANSTHASAVPWAVPPTALYLWLFWRYVRGAGWPRSTAEARRASCRANSLPEEVWGTALFAGVLGLVAVLLLQGVMSRLVTLPQQQTLDVSQYPLLTVLLWVVMGSLVAGVVEEASFRGYMQGPIERRHGPVIAILVTGSLFGLAHFTHPEVSLILLPYYLAVATVYGALAYLTNSILPSLVLHAGGNVLSAFDLFARGRSEWQASPTPKPLIWDSGPDGAFWLSLGATLIVGTAAAWAYAALASVVRKAGARVSPNPHLQQPRP
jgi:membrane protease YdiL (CAAX protease family)